MNINEASSQNQGQFSTFKKMLRTPLFYLILCKITNKEKDTPFVLS